MCKKISFFECKRKRGVRESTFILKHRPRNIQSSYSQLQKHDINLFSMRNFFQKIATQTSSTTRIAIAINQGLIMSYLIKQKHFINYTAIRQQEESQQLFLASLKLALSVGLRLHLVRVARGRFTLKGLALGVASLSHTRHE